MAMEGNWVLQVSGSDKITAGGGRVNVELTGAHDYESAMAAANNFMYGHTPEALLDWFADKLGVKLSANEVLSFNVGCTEE